MSSAEDMPKIVSEKGPKLSQRDIDLMKIVEAKNFERVQKLKKIKRNNIFVGSLLGLSVFGIYLYSIASVKQERFLDDFDEPATVHKQSQ